MLVSVHYSFKPIEVEARHLKKDPKDDKDFELFVLDLVQSEGGISIFFREWENLDKFRRALWDAIESLTGGG